MASPPFLEAGAEAREERAVPRKRWVLANTRFLSLLPRVMLVLPVPPGTKAPPVCRVCPESVVLPACQAPRVTEYVSPKILMSPPWFSAPNHPYSPHHHPFGAECGPLSQGRWAAAPWGGDAQCHLCPHLSTALGDGPLLGAEPSSSPGAWEEEDDPSEDEEPGVLRCCCAKTERKSRGDHPGGDLPR